MRYWIEMYICDEWFGIEDLPHCRTLFGDRCPSDTYSSPYIEMIAEVL